MRHTFRRFLVVALAAGSLTACRPEAREQASTAAPDPRPIVVLETTKGRLVLELDRDKAPQTVRNFLAHVGIGFYDGLIFHRVEPGFVIQAGYYTSDERRASTTAAPIMNESENGLSNLRGTVAMARTDYPHSATTQFFVNLVDNGKLDRDQYHDGWGYAVFGRVIEGLEVVDVIAKGQTMRRGRELHWPREPVTITRAFVQESTTP
ncbi:MAG: peptidylprolyl isomerase [Gemmatimonadota bacterium]|nr:peptidylprolyl isomerase [Gemmatimonadota bacterium]MDH3367970.1 peptidylprolyl isomerase [Gemmatimonadota bacterium]MDH3570403.1 peptidylprolyl isomerase [Gemmatimonadota bacterium]MDH5550529.1 peptidylprolyl isomerase [Gemmatimonadota bacterium]